jgi:hypothetical protein
MTKSIGYTLRDTIADDNLKLVPTPDVVPKNKEQAALLVSQKYEGIGRNGNTSGWDDDGGYSLKHQWI